MKFIAMPVRAILILIMLWGAAHAASREISWEDLVPAGGSGKGIEFAETGKQKGMPDVSEFGGSAEDMKLYLENMEFMKEMQPQDGNEIAVGLNGKEVKIAGYITPLTFEGEKVVEFLFVPYLGACMHVPPPPANQIIYVSNASGLNAEYLDEPFWLSGKLKASPVNTLVANTGYWMDAAKVAPYTE